jgi:hypothetical protein
MYGQEFPNLTGGTAVMLPNHHLTKPVLIGEIPKTASSTSSARPRKCRAMPGPTSCRNRRC